MLVVGSGILSPLYSQSEKDSTSIHTVDLDSLYSKALRGLTAIEDLKNKNARLKLCDSAKTIQAIRITELKEISLTQKNTISILKQDKADLLLAIKISNDQIAIEKKIGKKKWLKGLMTGGGIVVLIELVITLFAK